MEWLDGCTDPVARAAMKTWALAVLSGRAQVATGSFVDTGGRGFPNLYYAFVPGTKAMVVFYELIAVPVRIIRFVEVLDEP